MADVRTLKLNLLADVDQFGRGIGQAKVEVSGFERNIQKFSKMATGYFLAAGTAAGYMAVRIGKDSVKAFMADEAAQRKFSTTLKNTTNATDDQVSATEDWITQQQALTGFADDKLRPSFETLARVTGDVGKATEYTTLAMDISRGTGKDLETVSLALGKAYDGNEGALRRLGIPLDDNKVKTGDFLGITTDLKDMFKGQASEYADSYAGKMEILGTRTEELKESVGEILMPSITAMVDYANKTLLPTLEQMAAGFAGKEGSSEDSAYKLGQSLAGVKDAFGKLFGVLTSGDAKDGTDALGALAQGFQSVADAISALANALDFMKKKWDLIPDGIKPFLMPAITIFKKNLGVRAAGGPVVGGQAYRVGEFGPETFIPSGSGSIRPAGTSGAVTININGIVDAESARRSIEKLLQDSARRTGAVSLVGATL